LTSARAATIIPWATGDHPLPPYSIQYQTADGTLHQSTAPSLTLTIVSVLTPDDTDKRDLKPQIDLPRPPLWPWVLGGFLATLLASAMGWLVWSRLRRRRVSGLPQATIIDLRPPHEIAYDELDRIAALNLPAQGELKQHYTLVSDCLRTYIQRRYQIPALDQTTAEILNAFRHARVHRDHARRFHELFSEADLVKFAKHRPVIDQAHLLVERARQIVQATTPAPEPAEQPLNGSVESVAPQHKPDP
jgi:hypothetical protein